MTRLPPAAVAELDQYAAHWEEILDNAVDYVRQDLVEFDSETDRVLAVFDTAELIERNSPELITKLLVVALVRLARQSAEGGGAR